MNDQTVISSVLGALDRWLDVELNPPPGHGDGGGLADGGDGFEPWVEELQKMESTRRSAKAVMHEAWTLGVDLETARDAHASSVKRLEEAQHEIGSSVADQKALELKISELKDRIIYLNRFIHDDQGERFSGEKKKITDYKREFDDLLKKPRTVVSGKRIDELHGLIASVKQVLDSPTSRYTAENTEWYQKETQLGQAQRKYKLVSDRIYELKAATDSEGQRKKALDALETRERDLLPNAEKAKKYIAHTESKFNQLSEKMKEWEGRVRARYADVPIAEVADEQKRLGDEISRIGKTTPRGLFLSRKKDIVYDVYYKRKHPPKGKDSKKATAGSSKHHTKGKGK